MARTADGARGVGGVFALCSLYSVPRVVCWAAPKHGSSATKLRRLRQRSCYSACGAVSLDGAALYAGLRARMTRAVCAEHGAFEPANSLISWISVDGEKKQQGAA